MDDILGLLELVEYLLSPRGCLEALLTIVVAFVVIVLPWLLQPEWWPLNAGLAAIAATVIGLAIGTIAGEW